MEMNWTHSSRLVVLGIVLAVALGTAGTALAVSVSGDAPAAAEVGEEVSMEATVEDPFEDQPDEWTIGGETELESASWTIEIETVGGDEETISGSGSSIEQTISADDGISEVRVRVSGTVPSLSTFEYEDIEEEHYVAVELSNADSGETLTDGEFTAHRFTEESNEARQAIDEASEAVEASGDEDAQAQLENAIEAYNAGEFELATNLATEAQNTAESAGQTRQLLLIGGAVVVLGAIVVGGVFFWRSRQTDTHKLQ